MSQRKASKRRLKKYAIGDMRERITLHVRTLTSPGAGSASATEAYDEGIQLWASVKTFELAGSGKDIFDDIDINERPSIVFVVRYNSKITAQNMVRWRGDTYDIVRTIDPDERNEYIEFYCKLLGDKLYEAND